MQTSGPFRRTVALSLVALAAGSTGAIAQTPAAPAPAAANVPAYGPPITGVCIFTREVALGTSQAGVSVIQQLQQLSKGIESNLAPEREAIDKADKTLAAEKAKLSSAKFQERAAALQQRAQTFAQTVQTRNAQIGQSRDKAMAQIGEALTPIVVSKISEHHCSLVLESRGIIYGANPAMDLTPEVIQQLNTALPTVTVTLLPPEALQAKP
ncbi:MAG TPA: OmpH family outer membrane protein [Caulobacteraceae bacterium]|nr:OmpH family outer membrane protein [Caulobacteraceae bacterium]